MFNAFVLKMILSVSSHVHKAVIRIIKSVLTFRSSYPKVFYKKGVLRNFVKFTGKHLCQGLFLIKLPAWGLQLY